MMGKQVTTPKKKQDKKKPRQKRAAPGKRKLRKAEYEAGVMSAKKEIANSLVEMGLSIQQIAQGIKVEEKTVRQWLDEKEKCK